MAENDANAGPIILWLNYGCEGWKPRSFTTVKEALEADRYGNEFVITRLAKYEVIELENKYDPTFAILNEMINKNG